MSFDLHPTLTVMFPTAELAQFATSILIDLKNKAFMDTEIVVKNNIVIITGQIAEHPTLRADILYAMSKINGDEIPSIRSIN